MLNTLTGAFAPDADWRWRVHRHPPYITLRFLKENNLGTLQIWADRGISP